MAYKPSASTAPAHRLPPEELYRLRRAALEAEGRGLAAQMARCAFRQILLEIERKHKLLGTSARLDIQTGTIEETDHGPEPDANPAAPGPA